MGCKSRGNATQKNRNTSSKNIQGLKSVMIYDADWKKTENSQSQTQNQMFNLQSSTIKAPWHSKWAPEIADPNELNLSAFQTNIRVTFSITWYEICNPQTSGRRITQWTLGFTHFILCHRRTSQGSWRGAAAPRLGQNHYFSGKS